MSNNALSTAPLSVAKSPSVMTGIQVTTAAQAYLKQLLKQDSGVGLKLDLEKRGCSGLSYKLKVIQEVDLTDLTCIVADDLVLYINPMHFAYVKNLTLDYAAEATSLKLKKLKFSNPNSTGTCGCGESFTVEQ